MDEQRYGVIPKREYLRDPKGRLFIAFWNVNDPDKWTEEGVAFHRRLVYEGFWSMGIWIASYVILAMIF